MNRIIMMIIFISIVSLIYFGMHFVIYKFLVRSLDLSAQARKYVKILLWVCGLSFFLHQFISRGLKIHFLAFFVYIWLGIVAIAFFISLPGLLGTKIIPSQARPIGWVGLGIIGIIVLVSLINGLRPPAIREVSIPLKNLPQELSGFTVVQLSDVHMEAYKPDRCVSNTVKRVNELKPDLVVITGDLMDGDVCDNKKLCDSLRGLNARYGTWAVTGNHEYFSGFAKFRELAQRSDFKILRNQNVTIAGGLQLVGLDDVEGRRFDGGGPDLEKALRGIDPSKPVILLNHRPEHVDASWAGGADVILAGHTHAGQIPPLDIIVYFFYKYSSGLYEKDGKYIYTSPGTGYWGPPMRFLSRSEIVKIKLLPK